jgi:hypothetical protein
MAQFAIPTPDENLVPGWNVQSTFANASTIGEPGAGYAQPGVTPPATALSAAYQASAGFPQPPGALNIGSENSGSQTVSVLTDPGYSVANGTTLGAITAPSIPATTVAANNPSGLAALVTITGGTVTVISTAPFNSAGPGSATFTQVGTTTPATVTVPPGGYIKMTYSVVPTSWTWVATN